MQWFSRPYLVFLLSYGYHNMHRYTVFAGLKYNTCGYFTSCLECFRAQRERYLRRQWARFLLLPLNKRYIIPLLLGCFSRICGHARITTPTLPFSSLTFLNSIDTRKICFYCHTFLYNFSTFNNSAICTVKLFYFPYENIFYVHVVAEFLYVLSIILILCPIAAVT